MRPCTWALSQCEGCGACCKAALEVGAIRWMPLARSCIRAPLHAAGSTMIAVPSCCARLPACLFALCYHACAATHASSKCYSAPAQATHLKVGDQVARVLVGTAESTLTCKHAAMGQATLPSPCMHACMLVRTCTHPAAAAVYVDAGAGAGPQRADQRSAHSQHSAQSALSTHSDRATPPPAAACLRGCATAAAFVAWVPSSIRHAHV